MWKRRISWDEVEANPGIPCCRTHNSEDFLKKNKVNHGRKQRSHLNEIEKCFTSSPFHFPPFYQFLQKNPRSTLLAQCLNFCQTHFPIHTKMLGLCWMGSCGWLSLSNRCNVVWQSDDELCYIEYTTPFSVQLSATLLWELGRKVGLFMVAPSRYAPISDLISVSLIKLENLRSKQAHGPSGQMGSSHLQTQSD